MVTCGASSEGRHSIHAAAQAATGGPEVELCLHACSTSCQAEQARLEIASMQGQSVQAAWYSDHEPCHTRPTV